MSKGRRLAGSGALVATAAGLGALAVHDLDWIRWSVLGCAGVVAAAGIGLGRTSITAQLFSRATAWVVLAPTALVAVASALNGRTELVAAALAAGSGAALLLARPMLHTPQARAAFAPTRFRSGLLAGVTASAATAMIAGAIALAALANTGGTIGMALGFGALAAALLGSAIGVIRMRTWGILLGALTSLVTLGTAAFLRNGEGLGLSLAALPGALLVLPVLLARWERGAEARPTRARIADAPSAFESVHLSPPLAEASRVRIGPAADGARRDEDVDVDVAEDPGAHAHRAHQV